MPARPAYVPLAGRRSVFYVGGKNDEWDLGFEFFGLLFQEHSFLCNCFSLSGKLIKIDTA
jgi:hypothetical protein